MMAFFSLPYVANLYMGLFAQVKLEAHKDRTTVKVIQEERAIKQLEKECKTLDREERERDQPRITPAA